MNIIVIGTGYVGLVAGTCLADLGNEVICVDIDKSKVDQLNSGEIPIFEPGLKDILDINISEKRISFSTDLVSGIRKSSVVFIAVGTPQGEDHKADLRFVREVARQIGLHMEKYTLVVNKSTVPVGTAEEVKKIIRDHQKTPIDFDVVSNPEFLREGNALRDFLNPDRIVIGVDNEKSREIMERLYRGIIRTGKPLVVTTIPSSEMIKYASNAFLSTKISFMNELGRLCEEVGADIKEVARGVGLDERIGPRFLQAGVGYGGSCFPKDVKALVQKAIQNDMNLSILEQVDRVNMDQREILIKKVLSVYPDLNGKRIAIWGISFKPKTDDIRDAPAMTIIPKLQEMGAKIIAFDPVAVKNARKELKNVEFAPQPLEAVKNCDAVVIMTEWNTFRYLDPEKIKQNMKSPVIIDGRNIYEPDEMRKAGFTYLCFGRK